MLSGITWCSRVASPLNMEYGIHQLYGLYGGYVPSPHGGGGGCMWKDARDSSSTKDDIDFDTKL